MSYKDLSQTQAPPDINQLVTNAARIGRREIQRSNIDRRNYTNPDYRLCLLSNKGFQIKSASPFAKIAGGTDSHNCSTFGGILSSLPVDPELETRNLLICNDTKVDKLRARFISLLAQSHGLDPRNVAIPILCSSGVEANRCIAGLALRYQATKTNLPSPKGISSSMSHTFILNLDYVSSFNVCSESRAVNWDQMTEAIKEDPKIRFVFLTAGRTHDADIENPPKEFVKLCQEREILILTDACLGLYITLSLNVEQQEKYQALIDASHAVVCHANKLISSPHGLASVMLLKPNSEFAKFAQDQFNFDSETHFPRETSDSYFFGWPNATEGGSSLKAADAQKFVNAFDQYGIAGLTFLNTVAQQSALDLKELLGNAGISSLPIELGMLTLTLESREQAVRIKSALEKDWPFISNLVAVESESKTLAGLRIVLRPHEIYRHIDTRLLAGVLLRVIKNQKFAIPLANENQSLFKLANAQDQIFESLVTQEDQRRLLASKCSYRISPFFLQSIPGFLAKLQAKWPNAISALGYQERLSFREQAIGALGIFRYELGLRGIAELAQVFTYLDSCSGDLENVDSQELARLDNELNRAESIFETWQRDVENDDSLLSFWAPLCDIAKDLSQCIDLLRWAGRKITLPWKGSNEEKFYLYLKEVEAKIIEAARPFMGFTEFRDSFHPLPWPTSDSYYSKCYRQQGLSLDRSFSIPLVPGIHMP